MIKKGCAFDLDFDGDKGQMRVKLRGEIDHHSAVSVRSAIDAKIYELHPRSMTLDLSAIDFMDSSGLGLIMGRYAIIQKLGGEFAVLNPSERVSRILALSGIGKIISVTFEKEEAKK